MSPPNGMIDMENPYNELSTKQTRLRYTYHELSTQRGSVAAGINPENPHQLWIDVQTKPSCRSLRCRLVTAWAVLTSRPLRIGVLVSSAEAITWARQMADDVEAEVHEHIDAIRTTGARITQACTTREGRL